VENILSQYDHYDIYSFQKRFARHILVFYIYLIFQRGVDIESWKNFSCLSN